MSLGWYRENKIKIDDSVGLDEVGRGPLAGPVVAAAVWIDEESALRLEASNLVVRDSKKMTAIQRKNVVDWVLEQPSLHYSIGQASVQEIDALNILRAALLAMARAYAALGLTKEYALVDGNRAPDLPHALVKTVVKGDDKVLAISLASILAKAHRDAAMRLLAKEYPQYGWDTNVGYGTLAHVAAIRKYGVTPHHRRTFAPIRSMLQETVA
ncbi:MAG: ribonuclease HII [Holosporaceae bacterium]|jgi:ribonuclease HII|nr:ribonuclease HII [Holosporaceae bacterium]